VLRPIHPPTPQLINTHRVEAFLEIPQLEKVCHTRSAANQYRAKRRFGLVRFMA